jgi:tRNA A-37 threonylcarbamoyl transferase component Bud32/tetratricopeptide (TPR) repeat protein
MNECPTPHELQQLLDEILPTEQEPRIAGHLEQCPACRAILDQLTATVVAPWPLLSQRDPPTGLEAARSALEYRVVRYRTRGGLGEVFEVEDNQLQRTAALKILSEYHHANPDTRRRFVEEARLTAQLEHPGIVPVHAAVQGSDGRPGYVMRLVEGETLQQAIQRFHAADRADQSAGTGRLTLRELLSRLIAVCDAVAYAHSKGVLHRDIKPANIMLGPFGETVLLDWGLGKSFSDSDEPSPTCDGSDAAPNGLMSLAGGTPGYMSPEQAAGEGTPVGPASDIYNLGATLYCLLTGKPPRPTPVDDEAASRGGRYRVGPFPRPRQLNPQVAPALEAISSKALARQPEDRYPSATALARDIKCWLADEPVSARAETWWERGQRWVKRHRTAVAAGAAAGLVALVCLGVAMGVLQAAYVREVNARTLEAEQRVRADQARALEEQQRARADANLGNALNVMDHFLEVARSTVAGRPIDPEDMRVYYTQKAQNLYEQILSDRGETDQKVRRIVGRAYHGRGAIHALARRPKQAEADFREAQALQERLLEDISDPQIRTKYAADLAVTLFDLGQAYWDDGRREEAEAVWKKMAAFFDPAADRWITYKFAVELSHRFQELGRYDEALVWMGRMTDSLEGLLQSGVDASRARHLLPSALRLHAVLCYAVQRYDLATRSWDRLAELDPQTPLLGEFAKIRLECLARKGDHARAAVAVEALAKDSGLTAVDSYNLACVLAQSAAAARADTQLTPAQRTAAIEKYAVRSLYLLARCRDMGFFREAAKREHFAKDADFDPLRSRADFRKLVSGLQGQ